MCWILYKEKRCEQCGLGFTVRPVDTGRGTQRCLGWAVPSLGPGAASGPSWPWWAWLLLQVSGQWAGWEWGAGRKGRTFWPYPIGPGGGGVQPARLVVCAFWERAACLRPEEGLGHQAGS